MPLKKIPFLLLFTILLLGRESSLQAASRPLKLQVEAENLAITIGDYCKFLNEVAMADSQDLYNERMECIVRMGTPGYYTYTVGSGEEEKPITYIDNLSAKHYANWLNFSASSFCSCNLSPVTCELLSASTSTSTLNFNCCEAAEGCFTACDEQLCSSRSVFHVVSAASMDTKKSSGRKTSLETIAEVSLALGALAVTVERGEVPEQNDAREPRQELPSALTAANVDHVTPQVMMHPERDEAVGEVITHLIDGAITASEKTSSANATVPSTPIDPLGAAMEKLQLSESSTNPEPLTAEETRDHATAARLYDILCRSDIKTERMLFPKTPDQPRKAPSLLEKEISEITSGIKMMGVAAESDTSSDSSDSDKSDVSSNSSDDESDASPNSSDDEYGAKTLMRKLMSHVEKIEERDYAITKTDRENKNPKVKAEEITQQEIEENRGLYYVANFSGEYLDYFPNNRARRYHVKQALEGTVTGAPPSYRSEALRNLVKKYSEKSEKITRKFNALGSPSLLRSPDFLKGYVHSRWGPEAFKEISPTYGSPIISVSKDEEITPFYSDHPGAGTKKAKESKLYPKYSDSSKKPKHRLIGLTAVIVHEANEYLGRLKADIEKLRTDNKIGGIDLHGWNNQEIIFDKEIEPENIAGYIPLAYPNLSKMKKVKGHTTYDSEEKALFGLDLLEDGAQPTRLGTPFNEAVNQKTMGDKTKENSLYPLHRTLQWKLAEKYIKDKNPEGELIWVDHHGKFRRFDINQNFKKARAARKLLLEKEKAARELLVKFEKEAVEQGLLPDRIMLERVKNPESLYADDELNILMKAQLPDDTKYINPAIAAVTESFEQAIIDFKTKTNPSFGDWGGGPAYQQAVIIIHSNLHFMGIHIAKNPEGSFSITAFDPVAPKENHTPLHPIPPAVLAVLKKNFPDAPVINTTSKIQPYTSLAGGEPMIANNHCGPFVAYFMTEMAKGTVRLAADGAGKIQIKFPEKEWITITAWSKEKSDAFGKELRSSHAALLLEKQERDALASFKPFDLVNHYRKHINLCSNQGISSNLLDRATTAFDESALALAKSHDIYTMTTDEELRALDQEIAKQVPEKINVTTTLAKNSITRYGEAGLCYRQAGIAYSRGNEEEGKRLMDIAPHYDRSARALIRAVIALRNENTARKKGQLEIANDWHQLATLYQSVADHKLQAAVALQEGRIQEAKDFTKKATRLEEKEIEELREKLTEACDGIEPLFELEDGF